MFIRLTQVDLFPFLWVYFFYVLVYCCTPESSFVSDFIPPNKLILYLQNLRTVELRLRKIKLTFVKALWEIRWGLIFIINISEFEWHVVRFNGFNLMPMAPTEMCWLKVNSLKGWPWDVRFTSLTFYSRLEKKHL